MQFEKQREQRREKPREGNKEIFKKYGEPSNDSHDTMLIQHNHFSFQRLASEREHHARTNARQLSWCLNGVGSSLSFSRQAGKNMVT